MPISKDEYVLKLTQHQARSLNIALTMVNQLLATPPNTPVYPHLPTEGVERPLVVSEMKLLHDEVVRQFEEQDEQ